MIEWSEVDPQQFEKYPSPKPLKGPDDIDAVVDAVAEGKTVEIILADESAVRGRRMALGRRARQRGLTIQMRYQENKIIVRQSEPTEPRPDHLDPEQTDRPRTTRKRKN